MELNNKKYESIPSNYEVYIRDTKEVDITQMIKEYQQ